MYERMIKILNVNMIFATVNDLFCSSALLLIHGIFIEVFEKLTISTRCQCRSCEFTTLRSARLSQGILGDA